MTLRAAEEKLKLWKKANCLRDRSFDTWDRLLACQNENDRLEAYPTFQIRHLFIERSLLARTQEL